MESLGGPDDLGGLRLRRQKPRERRFEGNNFPLTGKGVLIYSAVLASVGWALFGTSEDSSKDLDLVDINSLEETGFSEDEKNPGNIVVVEELESSSPVVAVLEDVENSRQNVENVLESGEFDILP